MKIIIGKTVLTVFPFGGSDHHSGTTNGFIAISPIGEKVIISEFSLGVPGSLPDFSLVGVYQEGLQPSWRRGLWEGQELSSPSYETLEWFQKMELES